MTTSQIQNLSDTFDSMSFGEGDSNQFNGNCSKPFEKNNRNRGNFTGAAGWGQQNTYRNFRGNGYQPLIQNPVPLLNDSAPSFQPRADFNQMGRSFRGGRNNNTMGGFQTGRFRPDNLQRSFEVFNTQIQHWDNSMVTGTAAAVNARRYERRPIENNVKPAEVNMKSFENIPVSQSGPNWTAVEPLAAFSDLEDLDPVLLSNIEGRGYTQPTPVQKYALKIISANRDLMACAQTGSGKTAAFLIPIFNVILKSKLYELDNLEQRTAKPLLLVLAPTRELCCQIHDEAVKFARNTMITSCVVYGGAPVSLQKTQLSKGVHVLVATPGRLIDMLQQGFVNLTQIKFLVFDEADRMLDMGFEPQIRQVITEFQMPAVAARQTLMFSATFPKEIQNLAAEFLDSYVFLTVGRIGSTNENITQEIVAVEEHEKQELLIQLLQNEAPGNLVLIFVSTKQGADSLCSFLDQCQFSVSAIHGARDQNNRNRALSMFKNGRTPILVATAVAARGLDIPNVKHVINFDLPSDIEEYVHRIGRTGRIGSDGKATSFYTAAKNRNIVNSLIELLQEAKQAVPDFLAADSNSFRGGARNSYGRGARMGSNSLRRGCGGGMRPHSSTQDYRSGQKTNTSFVNGSYIQNVAGPYRGSTGGGGGGANSLRIGHFNPQVAAMGQWMPPPSHHYQTSVSHNGGGGSTGAPVVDYNAAATFYNLIQQQQASKMPGEFYGAPTSQPQATATNAYYGQEFYSQPSVSNMYLNPVTNGGSGFFAPPPSAVYNNSPPNGHQSTNNSSGHQSGGSTAAYMHSTANGANMMQPGIVESSMPPTMDWYGMQLASN